MKLLLALVAALLLSAPAQAQLNGTFSCTFTNSNTCPGVFTPAVIPPPPPPPPPTGTVPTAGLLLYYSFDTLSGTTVKDLSGNGHDGTLVGFTTPTLVPGEVGQALNFNSPTNHITTGLSLPNVFSISYWYFTGPAPLGRGVGNFIATSNGSQPYNGIVQTTWPGGALGGDLQPGTCFTGNPPPATLPGSFGAYVDTNHCYATVVQQPNTWYHFVMVSDGTNVSWYYNNALAATAVATTTNSSPLMIGQSAFITDGFLDATGYLDEYRVYNRPLTVAEIGQLYAQGSTPVVTNPPPTGNGVSVIAAMPPGTWYEVPNSKMVSVGYNGPLAASLHGSGGAAVVMSDWGGGPYDTKRHRMYATGGGHVDYYGNEVYAFDVPTLAWSEITQPSPLVSGWLCPDVTIAPCSTHLYGGEAYLPSMDAVLLMGFPNGGGTPPANSALGYATYLLKNLDAPAWEIDPTYLASKQSQRTGAFGAVDPVTGYFFYHSATYGELASYDAVNRKWTGYGGGMGWNDYFNHADSLSYSCSGVVDPDDRLFIAMGLNCQAVASPAVGATLLTWDISNLNQPFVQGPCPVAPATTCTSPFIAGVVKTSTGPKAVEGIASPGIDWDSDAHMIVGWAGGTHVYTLNGKSLVWADVPPSALNTVTPTAPNANGTFKRFAYDPTYKIFVLVNDASGSVFFYKPPSPTFASTTPPPPSCPGPYVDGKTIGDTIYPGCPSQTLLAGAYNFGTAGDNMLLQGNSGVARAVNARLCKPSGAEAIAWTEPVNVTGSQLTRDLTAYETYGQTPGLCQPATQAFLNATTGVGYYTEASACAAAKSGDTLHFPAPPAGIPTWEDSCYIPAGIVGVTINYDPGFKNCCVDAGQPIAPPGQGSQLIYGSNTTLNGGTFTNAPMRIGNDALNPTIIGAVISDPGGSSGTSGILTGARNGIVTIKGCKVSLAGSTGGGQNHLVYVSADTATDPNASVQMDGCDLFDVEGNGWNLKIRPLGITTQNHITRTFMGCLTAKCNQNGALDFSCGGNSLVDHGYLNINSGVNAQWAVVKMLEEPVGVGYCAPRASVNNLSLRSNTIIWDGPAHGATVIDVVCLGSHDGAGNCGQALPVGTTCDVTGNVIVGDSANGVTLTVGAGCQDVANRKYPNRAAAAAAEKWSGPDRFGNPCCLAPWVPPSI